MSTVLDALNSALLQAFAKDERVLLIGEDVLDPYGGAFKVTRGLSTVYPDRVLSSPISEAGIVGVATGMALRGLRPVVEIMFGDFITLIADQIINHATKFHWMYGERATIQEQVKIPILIRTPMGGHRGYGPTHSQTLEKLFLGIPGLHVLAPTNLGKPGQMLENAILHSEQPVLFIENKLLYPLPILDASSLPEFTLSVKYSSKHSSSSFPIQHLILRDAPHPTITLAAYGYMAELARQAMLKLAYKYEIFCELLIPSDLSTKIQPATNILITIEEGTLPLGWGAEVIAHCTETMETRLKTARRIAAHNLPIPASGPLEESVLPGTEDIVQAVRMMV